MFCKAPVTSQDSTPRATANSARHLMEVYEETMTTGDLLNAWRDATRAAEAAERLATAAHEAAGKAGLSAEAAEQIAALAEQTVTVAMNAANRARLAADEARRIATEAREEQQHDDDIMANARATEDGARAAYHHAEDEARTRRSAKST